MLDKVADACGGELEVGGHCDAARLVHCHVHLGSTLQALKARLFNSFQDLIMPIYLGFFFVWPPLESLSSRRAATLACSGHSLLLP